MPAANGCTLGTLAVLDEIIYLDLPEQADMTVTDTAGALLSGWY